LGLDLLTVPVKQINAIWIKWRWQKNFAINEEWKFVLNSKADGYCFVRSAYRSLARFTRLMARQPDLDPTTTPLALYWDSPSQTVKLVTARDIEQFMRALAVTVYDLHPVDDWEYISKLSSHSLRVGACVVLHTTGFTPLQIQWILRWKSTAFMIYLAPQHFGPCSQAEPST
jgi:hypothetical protein